MNTMPVLFVGHGSPMYVIEENPFQEQWRAIARRIPVPKAILCISAHWYCEGQAVCAVSAPRTIHDFYGFPQALYQIQYPAPGAPELAQKVASLFPTPISLDTEWGLDHGAWSILHFMYPQADIPVCQLSINALLTPEQSYQTGALLRPLRQEGVLIIGSGNIVHNLGLIDWGKTDGFGWADEFDFYIKQAILSQQHEQVMQFQRQQGTARAFVSREHFDPLLHVLGASTERDQIHVFNDVRVMGSLSMTSYLFEEKTDNIITAIPENTGCVNGSCYSHLP